MSYAKRTDGNHAAIRDGLRRMCFTVYDTSHFGKGFPDIVVGAFKRNFLFEIKNPEQPPSKRKLTFDEGIFHTTWSGQVDVIETIEQALAIITQEQAK